MGKREKISIRISPHQSLVLAEMSEALGCSYSLMIRTIIGDWLKQNEDYIYRIIDKKKVEHAENQQDSEEENIFGEKRD